MVKSIADRTLVLIPTLNEQAHIEHVLRQLLEHDTVASSCRIIVADGGSTDATRQIVHSMSHHHPNVEVMGNPDRTQAAAMNLLLGAQFEGYDFVVRCDAHAGYPPAYVSTLVAQLDTRDAASIVVPMDAIAKPGGCFQRGLTWVADSKLGAGGSPHRGGVKSGYYEHGHHAAFRLSAFRALGGYDTSFIANEDAEYDRRSINSGQKIWLDASARIEYYPRQTPKALWRQYFRYGHGRAKTCLKHRFSPNARQMIPVLHTILLVLSAMMIPFTALGWLWPIAYSALVLGVGVLNTARHSSLCGLTGALALAIMHLAWGLGFLSEVISSKLGRVSHG